MSSNRGFTLIETLVSLVVFLLIALGVTLALQHVIDGNVFDSQRQDVINATQAALSVPPPDHLCPPAGGATVLSATTASGLTFTINVTCTVTLVPMPPTVAPNVPVTQLTAQSTWTTFGVSRSVYLYD
ncbi:MAG: PulJ/GspJ family protein [Acidiferrobacter sp.]